MCSGPPPVFFDQSYKGAIIISAIVYFIERKYKALETLTVNITTTHPYLAKPLNNITMQVSRCQYKLIV